MIFLIEYDRTRGKLIQLRPFADTERGAAEEARLSLELALNRDRSEHEVVLLDAASEEALKLTHQRYFASLATLGDSISTTTSGSS